MLEDVIHDECAEASAREDMCTECADRAHFNLEPPDDN